MLTDIHKEKTTTDNIELMDIGVHKNKELLNECFCCCCFNKNGNGFHENKLVCGALTPPPPPPTLTHTHTHTGQPYNLVKKMYHVPCKFSGNIAKRAKIIA